MTTVDCATIAPNEYPANVRIRTHTFQTDVSLAGGGSDTSPGPHDYFDAALASCKALTAMWYARRHGMPLERVESHVESDDSQERKGVYRFRVAVTFHGPLSDEQRALLYRAIAACPIHKLMTTSEIEIETIESA
jgi:putative redox protein